VINILRHFRGRSAANALNALLAELADLRRSDRHTNGLRGDLTPFVAAHPRIKSWTSAGIGDYLRPLPIGPRRRDNIRDSIVTLSRFARRNGFLPEDRRSAAEKVRKIKPGHEITTWSPLEAELFLEHVSARWLPCLAIGLFAGLRKSEILRLDWSAFKWEMLDRENHPAPVIAVSRKIARKIRVDRLVPILPNLMTWLEPFRTRVGQLYPGNFKTNENACSREMERIRKATGLPRKDNANRHSFGSYRLALVKNYEQVALEMGNSARKVRENYNDPKSHAEGEGYFALARPALGNVIHMPLPLVFR
jgi:integrase